MSVKIAIDITTEEAAAIVQLFENNVWEDRSFDRLEDFYARVHRAFDPYIEGKVINFSKKIDKKIIDNLVDSISRAVAMYKDVYLSAHEDDIEILDTIRDDELQFNELADLIRAQKLDEAVSRAWGMDTLPRDYIPEDVWDFLTDYAQYVKNRDSSKMEMPL